MTTRTPLILLALLLVAPVAQAQEEDAEGSKDHPLVSRFPGYYITDYKENDFSSHEFSVTDADYKTIEGKFWEIQYALKEGQKRASPLQLARNYTNAFVSKGGTKVFEDVDASGGTMTVTLGLEGRTVWLEVRITNGGEYYRLTFVEEAAMEQKVEFTGAELAKMLEEKGSVAVYGITFDTGKATIEPESEKILATVVEVLEADPALKLEIQGHTDNVGTPAANLKLSNERAAAVRSWLVGRGIAAARLTSAGLGDTKPVADNKTEEGRAKNRRVELVKK
jgi:outer membrane protein OmpA-like peptidoglycan-associated protein